MAAESSGGHALPQIGDTIAGKLRIERELGRGGAGVVFQATHEILLQPVAVKLLLPEIARRPDAVARFLNEARAAARLRNDHVAAVLDVGTLDDGGPYIVLEYLDGADLSRELAQAGKEPLAIETVVDWVLEAMEGVAYAHALGFVHRDLKPSNLFRARRSDGTWIIKVLDFGLTKALDAREDTAGGALKDVERILGSPAYMSPEQIESPSTVDARTDIWSLGVVLFRLLSGRNPFPGTSVGAVLLGVTKRPAVRLETLRMDAPTGLARVIDRCLEKDRRKRFADVAELAAALAPFASEDGKASSERILRAKRTANEPSPRRARTPSLGARALQWLVGAAIVAGGVGLGATWMTSGDRARPLPVTPPVGPASMAASAAPPTWPSASPRSSNAQAVSAYRGAIEAYRHGQFDPAMQGYEYALRLDPNMGAAELRLASGTWSSSRGTIGLARTHLRRAEELRATLDAPDEAYLDALTPAVATDPPDLSEAARRVSDALREWPNDAELLVLLGVMQCRLGRYDLCEATYARAYAADGEFVTAQRMRAQALRNLGDIVTPQKLLDDCLARTPEATVCRNERVWVNEAIGRCDVVESDARLMIASDPNSVRGYEAMAIAGVALGRPHEEIVELLRLAWSHAPADVRAREQALALAHLAALEGRFDDALAIGAQIEQSVAAETTASVHGRVADLFVQIALERGDTRRAAAVAQDFLAKQSGWTESPDVVTGFFLRVRRDAGDLDASAYRAARAAAEPPVIPFQWADTYLDRPARAWLSLYAMPVASPEDAAEAIHAQPEGMTIPTGVSSLPLIDEAIGRTLFLAGRNDDALPKLRAAARKCTALSQPFVDTSAKFFLGRALEVSGDKAGACDAYAVVLKRWGNAKPRSATAERARARVAALACKLP